MVTCREWNTEVDLTFQIIFVPLSCHQRLGRAKLNSRSTNFNRTFTRGSRGGKERMVKYCSFGVLCSIDIFDGERSTQAIFIFLHISSRNVFAGVCLFAGENIGAHPRSNLMKRQRHGWTAGTQARLSWVCKVWKKLWFIILLFVNSPLSEGDGDKDGGLK